jgi:hypothetical protein
MQPALRHIAARAGYRRKSGADRAQNQDTRQKTTRFARVERFESRF